MRSDTVISDFKSSDSFTCASDAHGQGSASLRKERSVAGQSLHVLVPPEPRLYGVTC